MSALLTQRKIKVLDRVALMGANLYAHAPCIKWTIDLGEMEERPSNKIPFLVDRLKKLLPSLIEHRCSEGSRGGFFQRLDEGTWMGHVMEHIALELQSLAGADAGFGRTRSSSEAGVYNVVYECEERETGIEAGRIALDLIESLIANQPFPLDERVQELREMRDRRMLGPSTRAIVEAARRRGIPHIRLDERNLVQLGHGAFARRIQATTTSRTNYHGVEIAGDKDLTKNLLSYQGIPVPKGGLCRTEEGALELAREIGWPVVVKPLDASHGRGILTDIQSEKDLIVAFHDAKAFRSTIIVEQFLQGSDYRLLVINNKFVAGAQRVPARIIGDGKHTIGELVEIENRDPRRGEGHEKILTKIRLDEMTGHLLSLRGMTLDSVPAEGERVYLKTTANLSTGGFAVDVTDKVHPSNVHLAQRVARLVGLDIAGIDIVSPRIDVPLTEVGGAIVEVNAAPGFRMHLAPTEGKPRPVGEAVIDMLFPPGTQARIPIISVTGTNGKTTTARLCAHIAKQSGRHVGLTTTDGVYVNNEMIIRGDCTGPQSAQAVLRDPSVDFAVLETARGGLLRAGLGYDWSNVAIVTNIAADHLGLRGIHTLEDLAHVKAIPVERVFSEGYAVLNALDPMTPLIREHAECRIALFSLDAKQRAFRDHVEGGGVGVTDEDGVIVLFENGVRVPLGSVEHVPLTFGGRARFNLSNVLAAVAAAYGAGIDTDDIQIAIQTFFPSISQTPGRLNFFDFRDFTVVVDYAHNAHGIAAIGEFAASLRKNRVIGILGIPGDRRDLDIQDAARVAAKAFDFLIVREDYQLRGRKPGEVAEIIRNTLLEVGYDPAMIHLALAEPEAVRKAFEIVERDDVIMYFADEVDRAVKLLEELKKEGAAVVTHAEAAR